MRCTSPRTVGFKHDGKTLSWSPKTINKEHPTFQLPCGKCISCRLEYARQWAIRCIHEAQMHPENSFITLTYNNENCPERLNYKDFQLFIKKLRRTHENKKISYFVTGEYGDNKKRPHWHVIFFNFRPTDLSYKYSNFRGDKIYDSPSLTKLWGNGFTEIGDVTFDSAGYCARYAAKKLIHGKDTQHEFQPISKKSSKHAIGKKWLEKFWPDVFNQGHIVLPNGQTCGIPRYYEKWLKENQPQAWEEYVTRTKLEKTQFTEALAAIEAKNYIDEVQKRGPFKGLKRTRNQIRAQIQKEKFNQLQKNLKL